MEINELNEIVKKNVPGPDWAVWKGAVIEPDSGFASDKTIIVKEEHADETMFDFMEKLEAGDLPKNFNKISKKDAEYSFSQLCSNYAVNRLKPIYYFDLTEENDLLFPSLILLENVYRDNYVILDGRRYRILIEAVPVSILYGKGDADPVIAAFYDEEDEKAHIVGSIATVSDRSQKYIKRFRKLQPDLNL